MSLLEIETTVLRLFDDVAKSLNNVLRVEQRIHLGGGGRHASAASKEKLCNVKQEESEIFSMRQELTQILK